MSSPSRVTEPIGSEAALMAERDAMGHAMREGMCRLASGVVVVTGNPEDGWTLVDWDGLQVAAEP